MVYFLSGLHARVPLSLAFFLSELTRCISASFSARPALFVPPHTLHAKELNLGSITKTHADTQVLWMRKRTRAAFVSRALHNMAARPDDKIFLSFSAAAAEQYIVKVRTGTYLTLV